MKIIVDMEKCQDHGQCIISAPEVFWFNEEGRIEFVVSPDEGLRSAVEDAADVCPEQAIMILD